MKTKNDKKNKKVINLHRKRILLEEFFGEI